MNKKIGSYCTVFYCRLKFVVEKDEWLQQQKKSFNIQMSWITLMLIPFYRLNKPNDTHKLDYMYGYIQNTWYVLLVCTHVT